MKVTLKQLRANDACIEGYNKVVSALMQAQYEPERESYIIFEFDGPIPLASILETNGISDALWCLRCNSDWDRDSRLYAVWCARQVQHLMPDKRSIDAVDVAERYANGLASLVELDAARDAAKDAARDARAEGDARATRDAQSVMFIRMCNGVAPWQ